MKKLLTAICSLALVATMGFGVSAFAELDDTVAGSTTVTIDAVNLSGTAAFTIGYTVDPQAETLAAIWSEDTFTVTNNSAAPIFYVYTSANQVGAAVLNPTPVVEPEATHEAHDDNLIGDATAIAWAAMPAATDFSAVTDNQWTNIGITKTRTDWWLGIGAEGSRTRIDDIFTGEGAGVNTDNILASKYCSGAFADADVATDSLTIRTGTSFASAIEVTINVVITFTLTAGEVDVTA